MSKLLPLALGIAQSSHFTGAAALDCPVNPASYQFCLSLYPTKGAAVSQFSDDHARVLNRGKFYISLKYLYVQAGQLPSAKKFSLKSSPGIRHIYDCKAGDDFALMALNL